MRTELTADLVLYVREDGNDSNDGLTDSSGGAFLTIQKAMDVIAADYDLRGFNAKIKLGDRTSGTYDGCIIRPIVGSPGIFGLTFEGNISNPGNTQVDGHGSTGYDCAFWATGPDVAAFINGVKVSTSGAGNYGDCISAIGGAYLAINNIDFGPALRSHVFAQAYGVVCNEGTTRNIKISGSAGICHINCQTATVFYTANNIVITGSVSFGAAYAYVDYSGMVYHYSNTYTGKTLVTGKKYEVDMVSALFVNNTGINSLPGTVAGTTNFGGQYK